MRVVFYANTDHCPLCDDARLVLERLRPSLGFDLVEVPVDRDPRLAVRYALRVPVIEVDGVEAMFGKIDPALLEAALRARRQGPAPSVHSPAEARLTAPGTDPSPAPAPPGKSSPASSSSPSGGGSKLSEALGFGSAAPESPSITMPGGATREPRRAFSAPLPGSGEPPPDVPALVGGEASTLGRPTPPPDAMVTVRGGAFSFGEDKRRVSVPEFEIDRDPVTNGDFERFVLATGHRPPLYWRGGRCPDDLRDHPVVGVDVFDALAYARWAGKDLPYEDEWERAARGTDGRTYPWGDEPDLAANTARTGLKMTLPVGFYAKNVSPEGCRDMVGNAWELTLSPAPGGGVVVRGGSWFDFALYAKTYFRSSARADARNGTIGFRCVRRAAVRADAPRAVVEGEVEAAIAARKHKGELPDPSAWNPDRRDLVPDVRRLRAVVAANDEEAGVEARPAAGPSPARPAVRKAFVAPVAPPPSMPVAPPAAAAGAAAAAVVPAAPVPPAPSAVAPRLAFPAASAPTPSSVPVAPAAKPAVPPPAPLPTPAPTATVPALKPVAPVSTPTPPTVPTAPTVPGPAPKPAGMPVAAAAVPPPSAPPAAPPPPSPVPTAPVAVTPKPYVPIAPPAPSAPPAPLPTDITKRGPLAPVPTAGAPVPPPAAPGRLPVAPYNPLATTGTPPAPPSSVPPSLPKPPAPTPAPSVSSPSPTAPKPAVGEPAPPPPWVVAPLNPLAPAASAPPKPVAATPAVPAAPPKPVAATPPVPAVPPAPVAAPSPAPRPPIAPPATPVARPAASVPPASPSIPPSVPPSVPALPKPPAPAAPPLSTLPPTAAKPVTPAAPVPAPAPAPVARPAPAPAPTTSSSASSGAARPPVPAAPAAAPGSSGTPGAGGATTTDRAAAFRQAAAEASRAVTAPATTTSSTAGDETSSPLRFALLVMGFLAAAVFLVTMVLNSGRGGADAVEDDPVRLQLPALVKADGDGAFPVVLSGGSTTPDLALLEEGTVLVVFADAARDAGRETVELAVEMHRRLRPYDVRTVLVVPREVVTSDRDADESILKEKLSALGVTGDVAVLLDVADERGSSHLRRVRWQVPDANGAVVVRGGLEVMRVTPPSSGASLVRAHLAPLVKTAANLGGLRPLPEGEEGDAGDEEGGDDEPTALDRPPRSPVPPAMR